MGRRNIKGAALSVFLYHLFDQETKKAHGHTRNMKKNGGVGRGKEAAAGALLMGATPGQGERRFGWVFEVLVATAAPAGERDVCGKQGWKGVYKQEGRTQLGGRG